MPSPFPGMDPYLEDPGLWPDVHHELISVAREVLNAQLRPKYYVRIEERVYISDEEDPGRDVIVPDLRVAEQRLAAGRPVTSVAASASLQVAEPLVALTHVRDEVREARMEVIDRADRSVVTVSRGEDRPQGLLWPIRLPQRQRLPVIPIPLKRPDADAKLDLQAVLATGYDRAGYDLEIDYSREPAVPLTTELAEWARAVLAARGR